MTYIKLVFATVFWGLSFSSGKVAVKTISVFTAAEGRFTISLICFIFAAYISKTRLKLRRQTILLGILGGLTGYLTYNYFFLNGLKLTDASKASIIVAINPVFTAIIAGLFMGEPLGKRKILGFFAAFTGTFLVITKGHVDSKMFTEINLGDLLILVAAVSWSAYTLIGKKLLRYSGSLEATMNANIWGVLFLLPFAIMENANALQTGSLIGWANVAFLGVFATFFGFMFFYSGIKEIGAARASIFIYFVPLFGSLGGSLLLGESLHHSTVTGGLLIVGGVALANMPDFRRIKAH